MSNFTVFKIEHTAKAHQLRVEMSSATHIIFHVNDEGLDYSKVIKDICRVAPHMMDLDSDLMEANDGADVKPKAGDAMAVRDFVNKYRDRIDEPLGEMFELE